jgi:hypothetical protein
MKRNLIKWCRMIFIVTIAFSVIATTVFAKNTDRGAQEGINVHGHWKIVVMNPDGSVYSVTEFDNTLHGNGAVSLVTLPDWRKRRILCSYSSFYKSDSD